MDEWTVVTVIIALVGLFAAVAAPITRQTRTMTKLDASIENLTEKISHIETKNSDSHKKIWEHNEEQDKTLQNHEIRIVKLENDVPPKGR